MTELNIKVPLSSLVAGYDPDEAAAKYAQNKELIADKYAYQKFMGDRQEDGSLKLKELKPEHKQYITCYLKGMKGVEIANQFNVAAITVYRVLADPLASEAINEFDEAFKAEFKALFPLVSDAVRRGLESGNESVRLKAVDRWTKVSRFLGGDDEEKDQGEKTATVVAARLRFIDLIERATSNMENPKLIEAEVVEVTTSG